MGKFDLAAAAAVAYFLARQLCAIGPLLDTRELAALLSGILEAIVYSVRNREDAERNYL